jgi:hypothetical protein
MTKLRPENAPATRLKPYCYSDSFSTFDAAKIEHTLEIASSQTENSSIDKTLSKVKLYTGSKKISLTDTPPQRKMGRAGFEPA